MSSLVSLRIFGLGMGSNRVFKTLTARHGLKCVPNVGISVEEVLVAIGEEVGAINIKSASRVNKAVAVFLNDVNLVNKLVASGLWVKESFVSVLPLSTPSKKILLSNVAPFIENQVIEQILSRYDKLVGQIKMILLGYKTPEIKHVMSFRS